MKTRESLRCSPLKAGTRLQLYATLMQYLKYYFAMLEAYYKVLSLNLFYYFI